MTLREWINSSFGPKGITNAADYCGIKVKTIYSYLNYETYPSPETQELLRIKSAGQIDFANWCRDYLQNNKTRRTVKAAK